MITKNAAEILVGDVFIHDGMEVLAIGDAVRLYPWERVSIYLEEMNGRNGGGKRYTIELPYLWALQVIPPYDRPKLKGKETRADRIKVGDIFADEEGVEWEVVDKCVAHMLNGYNIILECKRRTYVKQPHKLFKLLPRDINRVWRDEDKNIPLLGNVIVATSIQTSRIVVTNSVLPNDLRPGDVFIHPEGQNRIVTDVPRASCGVTYPWNVMIKSYLETDVKQEGKVFYYKDNAREYTDILNGMELVRVISRNN